MSFKEYEHPRDARGRFISKGYGAEKHELDTLTKEIFPHLTRKEEDVILDEIARSIFPHLKEGEGSMDARGLTKDGQDDIITAGIDDPLDRFSRKSSASDCSDDLRKTNPNYATGEYEWRYNCQRCVPTYELRRRGYNVTAKPQPHLNLADDAIAIRPWIIWKNPVVRRYRNREDIEKAMREMGDGARVQIRIVFENGNGHTFVAEQQEGKTVFMDPQTGETDCSYLFKQMTGKFFRNCFWRVDNLMPSELISKCCL